MQKIQKIDDVISDMTKNINFEEYSNKYSDITFPISRQTLKNIKLSLKCELNEIENNNVRKIKIKRKQDDEFIETSFYFKC